ncbi:MAG: NAD(P)-binding domain-containing protein [Nitrospinota bacterium]|nr:NAD(P)-binding domain-containing protein [Nitrospinota bacterium]
MPDHYKIVILGAGPGGLSAAANAAHHKVSHILMEKGEIGNTIFDYQLHKHVMDEPGKLPLRSKVQFKAGTREAVLESWNQSVRDEEINVIQKANVSRIEQLEPGFKLHYGSQSLTCDSLVMAIGSMGSPRTLGVPGSDLPHINYRLGDPNAFEGMDIVVVGAGDAAIENALALCQKNRVSLINRKGEFARAKDANVALILEAIEKEDIRCYYNSTPVRVELEELILNTDEGEVTVKCNHLIARLGGVLPRKFLESFGVTFPSANPAAVPVVDGRYESNIKGLYLIGSLIGYPLIKQAINQGHEVIEHILGNAIEPADQVLINAKLQHMSGEVNDNLEMIRNSLPLFSKLSEPQFRELIAESTVHLKKEDDLIFMKDDFTDTFFSIVIGEAKVELDSKRSIPILTGSFFGEIGLLSGRRRSATIRMGNVTTGTSGILLETPRKQMLKLISSVESVKRALDETFMMRAFNSIFPDVSKDLLENLVSKSSLQNFNKGEVLFNEGETGDAFYLIRKGSVKISRLVNGVDVTQTYLAAGNYVGEMALINREPLPRSATVTAAVICETMVVGKEDFLEFIEKNPNVEKQIARTASERTIANINSEIGQDSGALLDFMLNKGISDADNILLIDSDLCIGCDNCESACASTHNDYSRLDRKSGESFSSVQVPVSCHHCLNPLCMTDCPPDALTRKPSGEIVIKETCICCGNCEKNCPYGVIQMVYEYPPKSPFSFLTSWFKPKVSEGGVPKAAKCDLCAGLKGGPACVRSCPTGAAMRVDPIKMLELTHQNRAP